MWVYTRKAMSCKGPATSGLNQVGGIMIKAARAVAFPQVRPTRSKFHPMYLLEICSDDAVYPQARRFQVERNDERLRK